MSIYLELTKQNKLIEESTNYIYFSKDTVDSMVILNCSKIGIDMDIFFYSGFNHLRTVQFYENILTFIFSLYTYSNK